MTDEELDEAYQRALESSMSGGGVRMAGDNHAIAFYRVQGFLAEIRRRQDEQQRALFRSSLKTAEKSLKTSEANLKNAENSLRTSEANLKNAENGLRTSEASLNTAQNSLKTSKAAFWVALTSFGMSLGVACLSFWQSRKTSTENRAWRREQREYYRQMIAAAERPEQTPPPLATTSER